MSETRRAMGSAYMHWAKTHQSAPFNLATSGVPNLPIAELPLSLDDVELTDGGYGYPPLLEAIAAKEGCGVENVVTAAGTSMANYLAMAALVEPGDDVLVEHPVYDPVAAVASNLGASLRSFRRRPEDGYRVDPDEIARLATGRTSLVVLTNLHNPSSALETNETLARVGEVARRVGARVLVDEVYLDAVFDARPPSAFHLGPEFVVTNSLTKLYGLSGLRCGWILAEPETARRMWLLNDLYGVNGAHPAERISVVAFRHLDRLLAKARDLIETNRRTLFEFYDTRDDLEVSRFAWGTTSFPKLGRGNSEALCALLREKFETSAVPGSFFGMDDHVRIGLTCPAETFGPGLERLGAALDLTR